MALRNIYEKVTICIQWGYQTSGDADEAIRCASEIDGFEFNEDEIELVKKAFIDEFADPTTLERG